MVKNLDFLGDSLDRIRGFPESARQDGGYQLDKVQHGEEPDDWKPMKTIGPGVREIRIATDGNQYRVIYYAKLKDDILVLHAFMKKSERTPTKEIELTRKRFLELKSR